MIDNNNIVSFMNSLSNPNDGYILPSLTNNLLDLGGGARRPATMLPNRLLIPISNNNNALCLYRAAESSRIYAEIYYREADAKTMTPAEKKAALRMWNSYKVAENEQIRNAQTELAVKNLGFDVNNKNVSVRELCSKIQEYWNEEYYGRYKLFVFNTNSKRDFNPWFAGECNFFKMPVAIYHNGDQFKGIKISNILFSKKKYTNARDYLFPKAMKSSLAKNDLKLIR